MSRQDRSLRSTPDLPSSKVLTLQFVPSPRNKLKLATILHQSPKFFNEDREFKQLMKEIDEIVESCSRYQPKRLKSIDTKSSKLLPLLPSRSNSTLRRTQKKIKDSKDHCAGIYRSNKNSNPYISKENMYKVYGNFRPFASNKRFQTPTLRRKSRLSTLKSEASLSKLTAKQTK